MKYKKIVLTSLLIIPLLFISLPALFVVAVDPCHIFHRPLNKFLHHDFFGLATCQNAGLINTYLSDNKEEYDSIVVGTSLSGNFEQAHFSKASHWKKTLKLTAPSLSPFQQKIIAEYAIASGRVKHVYWEVFPLKHFQAQQAIAQKNDDYGDFPAYLYNRSRIDDYRYIFNKTILAGSFSSISGESYSNIKDEDHINYYETDCKSEKNCDSIHDVEEIKKINTTYASPHFTPEKTSSLRTIDYTAVDRHLISTLQHYCNSTISFDIFIPPVSLLELARYQKDIFEYHLYLLRHIVEKTTSCKNINVHAFNNELWITGDLAHYSDTKHVFGGVQLYMVDAMTKDKHLITTENISEFENQLVNHVNSYIPWGSSREERKNSSW